MGGNRGVADFCTRPRCEHVALMRRLRNAEPHSREGSPMIRVLLFVCAVLLPALSSTARANAPQAQLHVGRFWQSPEYDGAEGWSGSCWQYPAGIAKTNYEAFDPYIKRGWVGQGKKLGSYLWSTSWTDPEGAVWQHAMSYAYRSYNYNYPNSYTSTDGNGNMNYVYPVACQEILRWERPEVTVDLPDSGLVTLVFFPGEEGLESVVYALPDNAGMFARPLPQIDPTLVTEEVIENTWRYIQGVELNRSMYAYPYGSVHQDYIIWDITLTNNGISGNRTDMSAADPWVMSNNSITDMVFGQAFDVRNENTDGVQADGDAAIVYPFGSASHPAAMFWDTDDANTVGPDWGDPSMDAGYNRPTLTDNCYGILGCLFASTGSGADYAVDDVSQPNFITAFPERGVDLNGNPGYPSTDPLLGPPDARLRVFGGAYQLDVKGEGDSFQNDPRYADVVAQGHGPTLILGYGPMNGNMELANYANHGWDLAQNESIRFVQLMAGGGIDRDEASRIASAYREAEVNAPTNPDTWMSAADVALVQSGEDTVMKAAALAYWNFHGQFPPNVTSQTLSDWNIANYPMSKPGVRPAYDVPEAPRPPDFIAVRPVEGKGNEIRWGIAAESEPDYDTGVADFLGYRLYRQEGSNNGAWVLIADYRQDLPQVAAADGAVPEGRFYWDWEVTPGTDYHYCVVAYDDGTQNWARSGVPLESTRWWTWTGYAPHGVTAPIPAATDPNPPLTSNDVSGTITTTTWTASHSPYRVTGAVTIPSGNTLTIEAGVDVLFDADVQFIVEGALRVHGTATDSVRFLKGTADEWGGIRISGGDSSSFEYARISDGNADATNTPDWDGGALHCTGAGTRLMMAHCVISGNEANGSGGGLAFASSAAADLSYCSLLDNRCDDSGGGVFNYSSANVSMANCTIAANTAGCLNSGDCGGGVCNRIGEAPVLINCILWSNSPSQIDGWTGSAPSLVTYSCIQGGYTGTGNIADDPLFVDAASGNYHLLAASPCIDAGDPASPLDPDSTQADMGALFFPQYPMSVVMGSAEAYVGDTASVTVSASFASAYSAYLVFTVDAASIESIELVSHAFEGRQNAMSSINMVGDTVLVGLASSEGVSLAEQPLATLRFHVSETAAADTLPLAWVADSTAIDDSTVTCVDGELRLSIPYGDVTGDRNVTATDAYRVLLAAVKLVDDVPKQYADVSGNGRVTPYDAALILYKVVDPSYVFPVLGGSGLTRPASNVARRLDLAESPTGWTLSVDVPEGIISGGLTIAMPGDCDVDVSGATLAVANRTGGTVRVAFVRSPSNDPVLLHIEPLGTVNGLCVPRIVEAELNEGELTIARTAPSELVLEANVPNPFNPVTTIGYGLPAAGLVNLTIYNALGQPIRTLVAGEMAAGFYSVQWDGRDEIGRESASGLYLYRLSSPRGTIVRRMLLVR